MNLEKPPYQKSKVEKIMRKDYVSDQFEAIYKEKEDKENRFKINESPELLERLVELANMPHSHFDDAAKMAEMIEAVWDEIKKENGHISLEELKLACLFHDIGKSGPVDATREERLIIEQIFNPIYFNPDSDNFKKALPGETREKRREVLKQSKIAEVLDIEKFPNTEAIKAYLQTLTLHIYDLEKNELREEKLDLNKHTMIDLWREHDYWTYELLQKYGNGKIPPKIIIIASTHHTLDGHDPANIDGKIPNEAVTLELLDKYLMLTLIDKYQAFVERSGKNHKQTIAILRNDIESKKTKGVFKKMYQAKADFVYTQFLNSLDILDRHRELAEIIKKK